MSHYLRVFNFLWRAKRMEYILTDIRKGHMCNAKLLRNMPGKPRQRACPRLALGFQQLRKNKSVLKVIEKWFLVLLDLSFVKRLICNMLVLTSVQIRKRN